MGKLMGIARAGAKRAPMKEVVDAEVTPASGVSGDARGGKGGRQVTVLFREGWDAACRDLGVQLPWVTRRANLLVEGLETPREGKRIVIGDLVLEVSCETQPCQLMEAAHRGLRRALTPDWRGGVCCRVVKAGDIRVGDDVRIA